MFLISSHNAALSRSSSLASSLPVRSSIMLSLRYLFALPILRPSSIFQHPSLAPRRNLTLKTISLLSWGVTRCPDSLFLAKIDDDVMVNPFHLHTYLQQALKEPPKPQVST